METSMSFDEPQEERFERAQSEECTPDSVNMESHTAIFPAPNEEVYNTSLSSCSCPDFNNNGGLPCKHMYRLAMETGVLDYPFKKGINKNRLENGERNNNAIRGKRKNIVMEKVNIPAEGSWNGFCITSFVLSLAALVLFWLIVPGILGGFFGGILGLFGLRQSKEFRQKGKVLAIWGIVLSCLGFILSLFLVVSVMKKDSQPKSVPVAAVAMESKETAALRKEKEALDSKLKAAEKKIAAMERANRSRESQYEIMEKEVREKQAQFAKEEAAHKSAENLLLKGLPPREKAFLLFKKKFLDGYRFPVMEFMIRNGSNDPDSFEHIELTCKFEDGKKKGSLGNIILQERFRGKNALGAKIINYAVMVYDFDKEDFVKERNHVGHESLEGMILVDDVSSDHLKEAKAPSAGAKNEEKGKNPGEEVTESSPEAKKEEIIVSNPKFKKVTSAYEITTYSWKVDVKNTHDKEKKVLITFKLLDGDGFAIETANKVLVVPSGKTVSVSEKGMVNSDVYKKAKSCEASFD